MFFSTNSCKICYLSVVSYNVVRVVCRRSYRCRKGIGFVATLGISIIPSNLFRCGNINFARRDKCYKCGRPKTHQDFNSSVKHVGKEFAEKSRGLFNPDDWECNGCGNVNWARRTVCNVCNAPKISTHGQRTGYGGGYMERDEVVDYKRHEDSDDEFDEFGLRKKKFRKTHIEGGIGDKSSKAVMMGDHKHLNEDGKDAEKRILNRSRSEDEDEEDDNNDEQEESGDDDDLSKYDILGDEEEGHGNGKSTSSNVNIGGKEQAHSSTVSSSSSSSDSNSISDSDEDSSSNSSESSSSDEGGKDSVES